MESHLQVAETRGPAGVGSAGRAATGRGEDDRRRPADILICSAQDVWTGDRGHSGDAKVALDVGIVCPQAQSHLIEASVEVLGAAEKIL